MSLSPVDGQSPDANALVQRIQATVTAPAPPPESKADPAVPHGEIISGTVSGSAFYPGTSNDFQVYVPAQYDPARPACLLIRLDGLGQNEATMLDNLIAKKDVPVMIAVGISPGHVFRGPPGTPNNQVARFNRCFQYDSTNDRFVTFVLDVLLPRVETMKTGNGRAIHLSKNPDDRATTGASSGGISAFTFAWQRPDQFHRVFSMIGTFVAMRGGSDYPALIRKTEPKPIRIFLEDGSVDAWNLNLGSWFEANTLMESALKFAGYDVAHAWGTHGHDGSVGMDAFPDVMRWLWRDYPAPIAAGTSQNDKLGEITSPTEKWQTVTLPHIGGRTLESGPPEKQALLTSLAADAKGEVWMSDSTAGIFNIDDANAPALKGAGVRALAFGPDGTLYASPPPPGAKTGAANVLSDLKLHSLLVTHDGTIYGTEPGDHPDLPSTIWRIRPDGTKTAMDKGLRAASGLAFAPDGVLFFAAENTTKWVYSYLVGADGSFGAKQPFDWLHMDDSAGDSGAEDLAFDLHGNLYVATRLGIQVCDQNGRVRAILPLPTPCGPVRGFCFGGPNFDTLYVTDGLRVFRRKMKVPGYPQWAAPVAYPSQGEG